MFVRMLFSVTTAELFGEFTDINYRICTKKATQKITLIEVQVERTILISIIFSHSNVKRTANQCASTSNDIVRSQHSCAIAHALSSKPVACAFTVGDFELFYCMLTSHTCTRNVAWNFHGFIDCYIYKLQKTLQKLCFGMKARKFRPAVIG